MKTNYSHAEVQLLLIQAVSFAVKQERNGVYTGAGSVAQRILNPDTEIQRHTESIDRLISNVLTVSNGFGAIQSKP